VLQINGFVMVSQYRLYQRKSGYFYQRARVPADIRQLYGKEIEQVSLRTRDAREAVRRLPAVIVEVDQKFAEFRQAQAKKIKMSQASSSEKNPQRKRVDIKRIAADYASAVEAEEYARRATAFEAASCGLRAFIATLDIPEQHHEYLDHLIGEGDIAPILGFVHRLYLAGRISAVRKAKATGDFGSYEAAVDDRAPGLEHIRRVSLIKLMMNAEIKSLQAWQDAPELEEHPEKLVENEKALAGIVPVAAEQSLPKGNNDLPVMSVLSRECFKTLGAEKKWSAKTELSRDAQIKQVIRVCGDKPINRYTQADIRALKSVLNNLPPHSHKKKEFKGLSLVQAAEKAKKMGMQGLSVESIRQVMTAASIVFDWARAEHDIKLPNIVKPMIPLSSSDGSKKDKRHAFTSEELQRLFLSPVFTGVESEKAWYKPGEINMQHTGRFWVPLSVVE
jgi:hypothetical protein